MPNIVFTDNIQRHVACPPVRVDGVTVKDALEAVFGENPRARGYVFDDQGVLRKHMVIFVDGQQIKDRVGLSDATNPDSEVYIMQALSGG